MLIRLGKFEADVEVADNILKQTKGLMFRNQGMMLFRFKHARKYGIWTFGMRFNLDILFLDEENRIVDILRNVVPIDNNTDTWKIYKPKKDCLSILEVPSGTVERYSLTEGMRAYW